MGSNFDAALQLAARGFRVFPLAPGAKAPPLVKNWPEQATIDGHAIDAWWLATPGANIGIHCDGMAVIDVDPRKGGDDALRQLESILDLPATLCTLTPSGGRHLFFRLPEDHPGVPNSVGELGPGLDIRSTGGYVVAPGSTVPAGVYAFDDADAEIAPAPQWLVDRLGVSQPRKADSEADRRAPDAPDEIVQRAAGWLKHQEPAVEGQGGDARTFVVICGLRDMGVSAAQALTLLLMYWNDQCSPPWYPDELERKVANAYRYATGEPGAKAALPTDFPIIDMSEKRVAVSDKKRHAARRLAEFVQQKTANAGYVVKGVLQRGTYAEAYGAPGEGKTFVALDIAYHVAADRAWMEHKVRGGVVLYLAYEGAGGMVKRGQALRQKYGDEDVPLFIVDAAFDLREQAGRQALGVVMAELPEKPVLIVVDTFARALMGGDENSAQDVGAFNAAVAALIASTGACVMIVHHSGKDKSKGARGSSALLGALDTEIEIDGGMVMARKQRDVEIGEPIGFKLVPVMVGIDEDGDEMTSCVVEPAVVAASGNERLSGNAKRGFDVLCSMAPDNKPVDPLVWRDACEEFLPKTRRAQSFYDMKKLLIQRGFIDQNTKGYVTRRME